MRYSVVMPNPAEKGTVSRDFRLLVFSWIRFPQAPEFTIRAVSNFLKICGNMRSSRCTTGVVDTGSQWKKSSIIKVLIILLGHLWEVELTYRYIFAFMFTLRYQQPDIVLIICHRCCWYRWCTLTCEYLRKFSKKFETIPMGYFGAGGTLIHEKN